MYPACTRFSVSTQKFDTLLDEILVNSADNYHKDKSMTMIKVTIDKEANTISVWNNGKGLPVQMH